jgi:hypothetical protein
LTFDAVHRRSNLSQDIPPSGDYISARTAMKNLELFIKEFPQARVVFGHDGSQLKELVLAPKYYV